MKTYLASIRGILSATEWIAGLFILSISAAAVVGPPATPDVGGQRRNAEAILSRMAEFLSKTPRMAMTAHAAYDAVQKNGT